MTWGIYLRLSKDDARGGKVSDANSITGQRKLCRAYINRIDPDAVIVEFAEAEFISASQGLERPEYVKMLDAIADLQLNHIVARDQDRFTRDRDVEFGELKNLCKAADVKVHTSDSGEMFGSPEKELTSGIRTEMGQFYSALLKVKTRQGLKNRRESGEWTKPGSIYGYDKGGVVNQEQAKNIRSAYDQMLNHGKTIRDIFDTWNSQGILTSRGKPWYSPHTLSRTLLAPTIAGIVVSKREVLTDVVAKWESIVSADEQERLRAAISARRNTETGHGQRVARKYMLAGKSLCGRPECDLKNMISTNNGVKVYYSHSRTHGNGCGNYVNGPEVDKLAELVAGHLLTRTSGPSVSDYDDTEIRDIESSIAEVRAELISGGMRASDARPILDGLNVRLDTENERKRGHDQTMASADSWHEDRIRQIMKGDHDAIRSIIDNVVVLPDHEGFRIEGTNGVIIPVHNEGTTWKIDLSGLRKLGKREAPLQRVPSLSTRVVRK